MSLNKEAELLRDIPLFRNISPAKLKLLAFTSERLWHDDEQFLFKEGDDGDAAYIILSGTAVVSIESNSGSQEVARLKKGGVVGEISILCDVPRTATVQAQDSLTTLRITKDTFFHLITEFPEISIEIMRELASRLDETNKQLREALNRK
ncbi:MAG: cyclic nucleotide-binding domain-containing protein [Rhodospirillaceae bacterium]|jgi:CRP/FNR family transcriptional regulator, cyclic AMP receptor protein|nr:cyclic nucleotide-binding domain-containing protein [Rhodospirillaceae bacterium]MBT5914352.1 cyclic nucleotide-binding domain-containing protein [Rhodospirillaceae bacterium]MBT6306878.1 cyclic nucleotide-binding domain-containing protein [Rhodospirillaceae bacterium]MBT7731094.1 cyclic nucleotide-binding domain-containing protein [Rhodospirillaceae bacterium]MDC0998976.1 cyclic nucleotide-binding domain-containing protein [Alphaproteobacteria bacterium]|tara:strand:- start:131 stop:580 length:450 start_codon:yes stop_codon:yes gene_type:complete